jgi:hypothetical protein
MTARTQAADRAREAAARAAEADGERKAFKLRSVRGADDKRRPLDALTREREAQARGAALDPLTHVVARAQEAAELTPEQWELEYEWFEHLTRPPSDEELQREGFAVHLMFGDDPCPRCHSERWRPNDAGRRQLLRCGRCRATWELIDGVWRRLNDSAPDAARGENEHEPDDHV